MKKGEPWRHGCLRALLVLQLLTATVPSGAQPIPIGGLLVFNSTIGRAARAALELAVRDVNNASANGSVPQLVLHLSNSNCSAFQGAAAALNLLKEEVVTIVGPQSSVVSHFVSHMGTATQVPMVSFSATDPSLSEDQYPFFVRLPNSDDTQMAAIAEIIQYYRWREVTAIYTDDDFGNNGVEALGKALQAVGSGLVNKVKLDTAITSDGLGQVLTKLGQLESRVLVVHLEPTLGRELFAMAHWLQMMTEGFVWIVTESMTSVMDDIDTDWESLQGVIGTRSYIPASPQLQAYKNRWQEYHANDSSLGAPEMNNIYAWFAYDAVWVVAHALQSFIAQGGNTSFVEPEAYPSDAGGSSELAALKVFRDGNRLLQNITSNNYTGITGTLEINARGEVVGSAFEIVNVVGRGLHSVGYWSNTTGCLPSAPLQNASTAVGLQSVIWPGAVTDVPRGWVVPKIGRPLVIGVPNRLGYKEFLSTSIDSDNQTTFSGFCIDVFLKALEHLPYSLDYNFSLFGSTGATPNYDALVNKVVDKEYDAVVGDVTITEKRSMLVDFTQPYTTSGLAVVVPVRQGQSNQAWAFMRPFTPLMWVTTGTFFLFTGLVLWLLEHKKNRAWRGRPKKQVVTTLWFIFSTLFFSQREKVNSTLGRAVLIIWLFVVLIIISSYTASLTSLLTVQQLMPSIQGISTLLASNVPIGYQTGSFVRDYLRQLHVADSRLVPLNTLAAYATALSKGPNNGGVGAIVDELPYVQLFLSSECDFTIAGQEFTKSGWGFAFPKGSQLAIDISTAILKLSESGELQRIHDLWLSTESCAIKNNVASDANELGLSVFWGLFLITGCASVLCCLIYWTRMVIRHNRATRGRITDSSERKLSRLEASKSFMLSLLAFIEEEEESSGTKKSSSKKKKKKCKGNDRSPDAVTASSSMPDADYRRQSRDHSLQDMNSASQELSSPRSWTSDCKPPPPASDSGSVVNETGDSMRHKELQND